jgi:hypothetical protein
MRNTKEIMNRTLQNRIRNKKKYGKKEGREG